MGNYRCKEWPEGATDHVCEECNPEAIRELNRTQGLVSESEVKMRATRANNLAMLIHASSAALTALVSGNVGSNVKHDVLEKAGSDLGAMVAEARKFVCSQEQ